MSEFLNILRQGAPVAGMLIGGPVGAAVGTAVSVIAGGIDAGRKKKEYDAAAKNVDAQDAGQTAFLGQLRARRRMFDAGINRMMGVRTRGALQAQAQTAANAARGLGGSSAAVMDTLLRSQNVAQGAINTGAAGNDQISGQLLAQEGSIVDDMAQRRWGLQTYNRDRAMAQWAMAQQGAERNLMASVGMLPQINMPNIGGSKWINNKSVVEGAQIGDAGASSSYKSSDLGPELTALAMAGQATHWK